MSVAYVDDHSERPRLWLTRDLQVSSASTEYAPPPEPRSATTNQQREPVWQRPTVDRLIMLLGLEPNWNGPGSIVPSISVAQHMLRILGSTLKPTTPPPAIAPLPDGQLQSAWYEAGLELEITVDPSGRADVGLFNVETGIDENDVTLFDSRLAEAIARISAGK